jgi:hypothetical protein
METNQPTSSAVMVYCANVVRELRGDLFEKCAIEYEDEELKRSCRERLHDGGRKGDDALAEQPSR